MILDLHRSHRLEELWLDPDLGDDDIIWPVVEVLERLAFECRPFDVSEDDEQLAGDYPR